VAEPPDSNSTDANIDLRDPLIAGALAWLIPGLGHLYQRRYTKAALFSICILSSFIYGCYLGSSPSTGWARVVYFSFRPNDLRLHYLCQVGVGLPALPALLQASRMSDGKPPYLHGFMAPPKLDPNEPPQTAPGDPGGLTLRQVHKEQNRFFELGTFYTMIAGLLNILAVYDSCCGPVPAPTTKKDDDTPDAKDAKQEKKP
jgi:hypothetical protein